MSRLVPYLSRFCDEHRLEKKYLMVPSYQIGHRIGEALAKEGGSWFNLHFVTLPSLAQELAGIELSAQGIKLVSQASALFLVDRVFRRLKAAKKLKEIGARHQIRQFGFLLEKSRDGNILVQIRPMNSDALGDQTPIFSLFGRGVSEFRKPRDRHTDFSAVSEAHMHHFLVKPDI